jgi:phosphoenolpyruvate carboxylase
MMKFESPAALPYHTYNSLFLSLPFDEIEETGTRLALFAQHCEHGFKKGKSPEDIVKSFWKEYVAEADELAQHRLLRYFIQYIERQVVLFDSVEDSLFEQTHEMNGPGSIKYLLHHFESVVDRAELLEKIRTFSLRLVLTAHPTQFYPGKVLGIINDLGKEIKNHHLENIRLLLMQLGRTTLVNQEKPTPYEEAVSLGWYMEHVFFHALPDVLYRMLIELDQDVTTFENPRLLALGFWPGGDRDGNPFVTADTTRLVADRLRDAVLRGYYRDIKQLKRRLSFRGVEEIIARAEEKIHNTLYNPDKKERYLRCQDLLDELMEARSILISKHKALFKEQLDRFILKIRVFGFHFASLDIRQESRKHGEVWQTILQNRKEKHSGYNAEEFLQGDENTQINRLLGTTNPLDENDFSDPFVKETIRSFAVIQEIQEKNGELGCHRYIISNCNSALNVAEVLALAKLSWHHDDHASLHGADAIPLDIVPLFETIEDLAHCGEIMRQLYTNTHYAAHLASRNQTQHIMLGFSDGTKDGGYLRANWSIYRAKEELTRVSRSHGISVIFFDGRGGPPGRGGGNNASYYAAQGQDIENQAIHVTIQGQTVSSTYGTLPAATFNIERLLSAGLENHLNRSQSPLMSQEDRLLLDELAESALEAYLKLKNHRDFVPYLEKMTPLQWYGDSNIASRPTKRNTGGGLKFEDLRAIPFVGAWAQMKQNVPGYYGLGTAMEAFLKTRGSEMHRLYQHSLFFRTLLENSMQSLSKSNFDVTRYIGGHPQFGEFWHLLYDEYQRTLTCLKAISGEDVLLAENIASKNSISLREDIVLPLITIQQFALQQLQAENLSPEAHEMYRKLVMRAMFGIINAARNAA